MPTDVLMPKLGLTMETGTVERWLAREGQHVEAGAALLEIETDKVVVEVEASASGTLGSIVVPEGESVLIGTLLARIYGPGEQPTDAEVRRHGEPAKAGLPLPVRQLPVTPLGPTTKRERTVEEALKDVAGGHAAARDAQGAGRAGRVFSSPRARKRARESGVDWRTVAGSGPLGRVVERDVLRAVKGGGPSSIVYRPSSPSATPHVYLSSEARVDALLEIHERLLPAVERSAGVRLTVTDLLVKILATALAEYPRVNAFWDPAMGGRIALHREIHIGIAVATDARLTAPVLHNANSLRLAQIAAERIRLVEKAQGTALAPTDLEGSTFTLTNLGMHRVDVFQAILNPPQSAMLAVGRITQRPVAIEGQVCVRPTMVVTLSGDHRVLDGVLGAQFLGRVVELIEEPIGLLA
jgi:pyruvate dehydrogenase E2 component (dihydrolipoyllysine-residue acetyltransferase)